MSDEMKKVDTWLELEQEIIAYYGGDKEVAALSDPLPHALSKIARLTAEKKEMGGS